MSQRQIDMTVSERTDGMIDVRFRHADGTADVTVPLVVSGAEELARMLTTVAAAVRARR